MKAYWILLVVAVGLVACKPENTGSNASKGNSALEKQEKELMDVHDTAMAKLAEINQLSTELRAIRSNITELPDGGYDVPAGLDKVMEGLKLADQKMWDWMKSYSDTKATLQEDQYADFYKAEMPKIKLVDSEIDASIERAKTWLTAHGTK